MSQYLTLCMMGHGRVASSDHCRRLESGGTFPKVHGSNACCLIRITVVGAFRFDAPVI